MSPVIGDADKLYIGSQLVDKAYVGATRVWPKFLPTDLSGLALWFDAPSLPQPTIGADERMLAVTAPATSSTGSYNLGTRFVPSVDGRITHLRWWHQAACSDTHVMSVWDAAGNRVGFVTDVPGSATGWREVAFPAPIAVKAGATYTVSYSTGTHGWGYTTAAPASLAPSLGSLTGVYAAYDSFPNTAAGNIYHADLVFQKLTGGRISSWPNLGSGPVGAIVGTPTPLVVPGGPNGRSVVRMWSNEGRVRINSGLGVDTAWTLAYVARFVGPTTGRIAAGSYSTRNLTFGFYVGKLNSYFDNGWSTPDAQINWTTAWRLYSGDGAGVNGRIFNNGTLLSSVTSSLGWGNTFALNGLYAATTEETCDCEVAEAVMYNRKLTDADRQTVEAYLRKKWAIT